MQHFRAYFTVGNFCLWDRTDPHLTPQSISHTTHTHVHEFSFYYTNVFYMVPTWKSSQSKAHRVSPHITLLAMFCKAVAAIGGVSRCGPGAGRCTCLPLSAPHPTWVIQRAVAGQGLLPRPSGQLPCTLLHVHLSRGVCIYTHQYVCALFTHTHTHVCVCI